MAHINLGTYGQDIEAARLRVLKGDPEASWALFVTDKDSNLKLQEVNEGTLEDLEEEFDGGKIQYAFARVSDPNSQLTKFVFISWCGDGVPTSMKGRFNSHVADVGNFLKGHHIHINARNEDDVKTSHIMAKVRDSSGAKYSVHNEAPRKEEPIKPVGSVYKPQVVPDLATLTAQSKATSQPSQSEQRSEPRRTSHSSSRSDFENSLLTKRPSAGDLNFAPLSIHSGDTPRRDRVAQEQAERARESRGNDISSFSNPSAMLNKRPSAGKLNFAPVAVHSGETPRKNRESQEAAERSREMDSINKKQSPNNSNENLPGPSALLNKRPSAGRLQFSPNTTSEGESVRETRERQEREERKREEEAHQEREARAAAGQSQKDDQLRRDEEERESRAKVAREKEEEQRRLENERQSKKIQEDRRVREQQQLEDDRRAKEAALRQEEESRQEDATRRGSGDSITSRIAQTASSAATTITHAISDTAKAATSILSNALSSTGITATVLYTYDAAEANEMSLVADEIITNIEKVAEGWWSGTGANGGKSGLFPSNYVEVIEAPTATHQEEDRVQVDPSAAEPAQTSLPQAADNSDTVVAAYDYAAAEENELSFKEGDTIYNIVKVSPDWWQGEVAGGHGPGLFPANYVQ